MYELSKLLHLAAAIAWLGGMTFMLWTLRPVAITQLPPPVRVPLLAAVLARFVQAAWVSIGVLLLTGGHMLSSVSVQQAPLGWHAMLGLGLLMFALFGHLYFSLFRPLKRAVAAADWPLAGRQLARIHPLVIANFVLGWLAVAAVILLR